MLRRLMIAGASAPVTDPYWANVLMLLRFNGNAAEVKGRPFVLAGTPAFVPGKFGQAIAPEAGTTASGATDSTSEYVDYALGVGDFTIECWANANTSLSTDGALISFFDTISTNGWQLLISPSGAPRFYQYASGGSYPLTATGINLRDGAWHHIAVSRNSGTLRMFVDGMQVASAANSTNYGYSLLYMSIGYQRQGNSRYPFNGAIDEVRVTKGVGRYTSTFAVPSAPFPGS